jgi:hypothetical protein
MRKSVEILVNTYELLEQAFRGKQSPWKIETYDKTRATSGNNTDPIVDNPTVLCKATLDKHDSSMNKLFKTCVTEIKIMDVQRFLSLMKICELNNYILTAEMCNELYKSLCYSQGQKQEQVPIMSIMYYGKHEYVNHTYKVDITEIDTFVTEGSRGNKKRSVCLGYTMWFDEEKEKETQIPIGRIR